MRILEPLPYFFMLKLILRLNQLEGSKFKVYQLKSRRPCVLGEKKRAPDEIRAKGLKSLKGGYVGFFKQKTGHLCQLNTRVPAEILRGKTMRCRD